MAPMNTESDATRIPPQPQGPFLDSSRDEFMSDASVGVGSHQAPWEDPSLYYDMSGDKILIIFNHYCYHDTDLVKNNNIRRGTYEDVKSLERTFSSRGFMVITHDDWTARDITKYLSKVSKMNHKKTSCLAIAIMTHGMGSHVCAYDQMLPVTAITDVIRKSPKLAGKPKLFFIQACRAEHTSPRDEEIIIPEEPDSLVLYSTYQDYVSFRSIYKGSWMMQALCQVIDSHHGTMDLVTMALRVNNLVAARSTNYSDKQMPVPHFNLTKFLIL